MLMITKNSVVKIQNLVVNHKSQIMYIYHSFIAIKFLFTEDRSSFFTMLKSIIQTINN